MNKLSTERQAAVLGQLCEGMSIRGTCRVTGVARETVNKLILRAGDACAAYQDQAFRALDSERVECDEIWSFVGAKERNVRIERSAEDIGSVWTWVALDADSKLVVTWRVGDRGLETATDFMADLADRLTGRIQLSTDAWSPYRRAVRVVFGDNVDHATITKTFAKANEDRRYSPGRCTGVEKTVRIGDPDMAKASTAFVERQNLSIRMGSRRYTRLTNAFSKRLDQHIAATALHFAYYNLVRTHGTLTKKYGRPTTPAMAAGIENEPWDLLRLARLIAN